MDYIIFSENMREFHPVTEFSSGDTAIGLTGEGLVSLCDYWDRHCNHEAIQELLFCFQLLNKHGLLQVKHSGIDPCTEVDMEFMAGGHKRRHLDTAIFSREGAICVVGRESIDELLLSNNHIESRVHEVVKLFTNRENPSRHVGRRGTLGGAWLERGLCDGGDGLLDVCLQHIVVDRCLCLDQLSDILFEKIYLRAGAEQTGGGVLLRHSTATKVSSGGVTSTDRLGLMG